MFDEYSYSSKFPMYHPRRVQCRKQLSDSSVAASPHILRRGLRLGARRRQWWRVQGECTCKTLITPQS